jgi:hypothetical protein
VDEEREEGFRGERREERGWRCLGRSRSFGRRKRGGALFFDDPAGVEKLMQKAVVRE